MDRNRFASGCSSAGRIFAMIDFAKTDFIFVLHFDAVQRPPSVDRPLLELGADVRDLFVNGFHRDLRGHHARQDNAAAPRPESRSRSR